MDHDHTETDNIDITEKVRNSTILQRLVEEVRLEQKDANPNGYRSGYDRMHNRHNRSR